MLLHVDSDSCSAASSSSLVPRHSILTDLVGLCTLRDQWCSDVAMSSENDLTYTLAKVPLSTFYTSSSEILYYYLVDAGIGSHRHTVVGTIDRYHALEFHAEEWEEEASKALEDLRGSPSLRSSAHIPGVFRIATDTRHRRTAHIRPTR